MDDSIRILAVTNLYPNPMQPHRATFNRQQFAALARRHPVEVIAPVAWTDEVRLRVGGRGWTLSGARRETVDGIAVGHPRYMFPPRVMRQWYGHCFRWSIAGAFRAAVERFRPDIVLAAWAYPDGWAAVELARRAGLPVVIKVHGSDVLELPAHPDRAERTAEALRGADGVVAVSQHLAKRMAEMGVDPGRIHVLYDGVDPEVFSPGPRDAARAKLGLPAGGNVLLSVGNLLKVKGPDVLLEACVRLAGRGVAFTCYFAGDGPMRAGLEARAAAVGLGNCVKFLGPVAHSSLADWFRAADVFVLASRSEGVPCVLLEALGCGTPFVATSVGGIPEIAGMGPSKLVPPESPEQLAHAIAGMLAEPPARPAVSPVRGHDEAAAELAGFLGRVRERYVGDGFTHEGRGPGAARFSGVAGM